ncbi:hypothetical protein [Lentzea sp.]|uniref:hypothetical protein n=1 Tax=Lentzea sp. TaxID=56099 RepID=UPI002ED5412C
MTTLQRRVDRVGRYALAEREPVETWCRGRLTPPCSSLPAPPTTRTTPDLSWLYEHDAFAAGELAAATV